MKIHESRRVAIQTKFIGPTDTRGSRYKAFTESGRSITIHAADNLSPQENHRQAALALCNKMKWNDEDMIEGGTQVGYVYVFIPRNRVLS